MTKKSQFQPKANTTTMALSPGSFVLCGVWGAEQGAGAGRVSPEWTQSLTGPLKEKTDARPDINTRTGTI